MSYENLDYRKQPPVAYVTIDRPAVMNAIDPPTSAAMARVWQDFVADDSLRVAILTGAGDKAFCAGADLKYRLRHPDYSYGRGSESFPQTFGGLVRAPIAKPVIAAVNGYCLGGGLELVLACDIAVASETATFGFPEVKNAGTIPGSGGTLRIPRQVALKIAMWMLLSGERLTADEALRAGLVNRVVPQHELMAEATRMAHVIAANRPEAVRMAKEIALRSLDRPLVDPPAAWDLYDLVPDTESERQAQIEARKAFFARASSRASDRD
jgi:enoyl-CoA hydratase/carnithine racemase